MGTGSGVQSQQMDLSAGSMCGTRQPSLFWENTNIPHSNFSVKCFAISDSVKSFSSSHLDLLNSHLHLHAFQCSSHLLQWLSCLNPPSEPPPPGVLSLVIGYEEPISPFWFFLDFLPKGPFPGLSGLNPSIPALSPGVLATSKNFWFFQSVAFAGDPLWAT